MTTATTVRPVVSRKGGRGRRWPAVLAAVLALLLGGGAAYLLWFTSVLGVKSVVVLGADDDLAAQVRTALDIPVGTPLIRVDLDAADDRVDQLPLVGSAQVSRKWPNTLLVQIMQRTPVAVTSANGRLWLLDSSGTPYLQVATAPARLTTVELATPGAGDPATVAALKVVGAMTAEFRSRVTSVRAPTAYGITVQLNDGRTVVWGGSDEGARKMQVLPGLLTRPGRTYDISVPNEVTVH